MVGIPPIKIVIRGMVYYCYTNISKKKRKGIKWSVLGLQRLQVLGQAQEHRESAAQHGVGIPQTCGDALVIGKDLEDLKLPLEGKCSCFFHIWQLGQHDDQHLLFQLTT